MAPADLMKKFEKVVPVGVIVTFKRSLKLRPAHAIRYGRRRHKVLVPLIIDELSFAFAVHEVGHCVLGHFDKEDDVTDEYDAEQWTIKTMRRLGVPVTRAVMKEMKDNVYEELDMWYRCCDTIAPAHVRKWCGWRKPQLETYRGKPVNG